MRTRKRIAEAQTPSGGKMELYQHDRDFSITVDGHDLMESRQHESELALARLGCAHLTNHKAPRVLVGGLGMGYTLHQTLSMLPSTAQVLIGELLMAVVEWNRDYLGTLTGHPLRDPRAELVTGDVINLIAQSSERFDAILLDVDNGPSAMTDSRNSRLYGHSGIDTCRRGLRAHGCLAVWSAAPSKPYEQRLMECGFHVRRYSVPAYAGSKSKSRFVWVASEDEAQLPPGGGTPRAPIKKEAPPHRRRRRRKR